MYPYMGHSESNEIRRNFCTSDNKLSIKFWLPTFSAIRILNPKVDTVQKNSTSIYGQPIPAPLSSVMKNRVFIYRRYSTNVKIN